MRPDPTMQGRADAYKARTHGNVKGYEKVGFKHLGNRILDAADGPV